VRRAEAELAEAQQMLVLARSERQKMGLELLAEMAASMDQPIEPIDPLTFAPPTESLEAHVKAAKEQRGDSLAAQARVRSAEAQLSSARGALSPQLYGFAMGDSFRSSEMGNDSGYSIGVVASLPLFDGGMRSAEIDRASAALRQAKAERDAVDLRVEREVRQAWIDVQAAAENYATAESALRAAEAAYEVARLRYESGRAILIEQLDALSSLTRARANLVRTLSDHQIAVARLGRAAGFRPEINQGDKT
jgi:outer membrane protein TolC